MAAPMLCAHRRAHVQASMSREARATGMPVEVVRISAGLTREYIPLTSLFSCAACTSEYTSPLAAAECCDS